MAKLIGNAPNQVPTNGDLGSMAFEDRTNYITKGASVHQPYRNIIINGDMSIAQRGTSSSGITGGGFYTVDRFAIDLGSLGTWTMSQSTDVPTGEGFAKSLKMDCTTADATPSASDYLLIRQKFEGQNLQYLKKGTANAVSLTASFWVKSVKTGTYILSLHDQDNSRNISKSYTIDSANTWEKKTLTFAGDTTGAFTNDNNNSLEIWFFLGAGTDWTSGTLATSWEATTTANLAVGQVNLADNTANEWYITGVQLEAGTTASDFEFLPYDVNLQRCLRYCKKWLGNQTFENIGGGSFNAYNSTGAQGAISLPVKMRTTPSISFSTLGFTDVVSINNSVSNLTINTSNSGTDSINMTVTTTGLTVGRTGYLYAYSSTSAFLIADSEL